MNLKPVQLRLETEEENPVRHLLAIYSHVTR